MCRDSSNLKAKVRCIPCLNLTQTNLRLSPSAFKSVCQVTAVEEINDTSVQQMCYHMEEVFLSLSSTPHCLEEYRIACAPNVSWITRSCQSGAIWWQWKDTTCIVLSCVLLNILPEQQANLKGVSLRDLHILVPMFWRWCFWIRFPEVWRSWRLSSVFLCLGLSLNLVIHLRFCPCLLQGKFVQ
jgi:hypothetical protein